MHKSGTTLVSKILHHSGINMGDHDEQVSYDRGNQYERYESLALNMEILGLKTHRIIDKPTPTNLQLSPAQRARMQDIIQQCSQKYTDWGFKDPRTSLIYPLWAAELPAHKIIVIYRTPSELWPRFQYPGWWYAYTNPQNAWNCISRWCEHNQRIVESLQNSPTPYLVLNYQALMNGNQEFERLQKFVGRELNDQRKSNLYRSRSKKYFLLEVATWLVNKKTGCHPQKIIEQLELLRQFHENVV
jgi:hypothetical protein